VLEERGASTATSALVFGNTADTNDKATSLVRGRAAAVALAVQHQHSCNGLK